MEDLPTEVLVAIVERLESPRDFQSLLSVNRRIALVCTEIRAKTLWEILLESERYKGIDQRYNLDHDGGCFACLSLYESIFRRETAPYKVRAWLYRRASKRIESPEVAKDWAGHIWKLVDAEEGDPDLLQRVECWCPGRVCLDQSMCIEWKKGWRNSWQDHMNERRPPSNIAGWEVVLSKSERREIVIAELPARL